MNSSSTHLPVHSLDNIENQVIVRRIEHKNPYDFTREHRHTYFEVFFFEEGGGKQLIDFVELPVYKKSCYIVFPQQIHLLKRAPKACGRLVQFGEAIVASSQLRILLQQHFFSELPAVFFNSDKAKFKKLESILDLLEEATINPSINSREIALHYLHALLYQLLDDRVSGNTINHSGEARMLFSFQQLLEQQFQENHKVAKYASQLNITEKKLATLTKKFLGLSPLQVIHNRLLLEAKRLLLFEPVSQKEIAFQLGFDSPASFSLFIKNKSGFTPSELNNQLVKIHK